MIQPPILTNFLLCFLTQLSFPTKKDKTKNGIAKPRIYAIINGIPYDGGAAAIVNTIVKMGPVQGVHPKEKAKPIRKVPKKPDGLFINIIERSFIKNSNLKNQIMTKPSKKKNIKIMNSEPNYLINHS